MHTPVIEQALSLLKEELDNNMYRRGQMEMETDNRRMRTHHQDGDDRPHKRKWGTEIEGDHKRRRETEYPERNREDNFRGRDNRPNPSRAENKDRHRSLSPGGTKKLFGDPSPSLWVGNFNRTSKEKFPLGEDELRREFAKYGNIFSIKAYPPKNCAFINFWSVEDATRAAEALTGTRINDIKILVNFGKAPTDLMDAIQGKPDSRQERNDREKSDKSDRDRSERSEKRIDDKERDDREIVKSYKEEDSRIRDNKPISPEPRLEEPEPEPLEEKRSTRSISRSPPHSPSPSKVRTPEESRSPYNVGEEEENYDEAFDFEITRHYLEKKLLKTISSVNVDLIGKVVRVNDLFKKDRFVIARIAAVNPKDEILSLEQYPKDPRRLKPEKVSSLAADPQPSESEIKRWVKMQKKFAILLDIGSLLHNLKKVKAVADARNPYLIFTLPYSVKEELQDLQNSSNSEKSTKATNALGFLAEVPKKSIYVHPPSHVKYGSDAVEELRSLVPKERFADVFITMSDVDEAKKLSSTLKVITFDKMDGIQNIFFWDYIMDKLLKY